MTGGIVCRQTERGLLVDGAVVGRADVLETVREIGRLEETTVEGHHGLVVGNSALGDVVQSRRARVSSALREYTKLVVASATPRLRHPHRQLTATRKNGGHVHRQLVLLAFIFSSRRMASTPRAHQFEFNAQPHQTDQG